MRAHPAAALLLLLAAPAPAAALAPAPVVEAVERAIPVPGTRAEVSDFRPELAAGCTVIRAELPGPLSASGRVPVRLSGTLQAGGPCDGWGWVAVRLVGTVLVASKAVAAGAPLRDAVAPQERELRSGRAPISRLPDDAVAGRAIAAGQVLEERDLRVGPVLGDEVTVVLRLGAVKVEQIGRAVPCSRGRACAQMPSGKRVEGSWQGGRIHVESR